MTDPTPDLPSTEDSPEPLTAPAEAPAPPEEPQYEARGLLWLIVPPLICAAIGALIGTIHGLNRVNSAPGVPLLHWTASGATIGAILGGIVGVFVWVVFPYRRLPGPPEGDTAAPPQGALEPDEPDAPARD